MSVPVRRLGATFVGVLLIQAAWILVLPPFGGIDEHEHVFKAAAVAHGDFSPHHIPSDQGWGEFVTVPRSLARAAEPECRILSYTHSDNCVGSVTTSGDVRIASSAARYNPLYYVVLGVVGQPFSGDTALYVMRAVSALLCALMITAAFFVTRSWSRTPWPSSILLLTLTPTAVYSTTTVAPNGIEICGGLLLWSCLVGLGNGTPRRLRTETLFVLASIASVPLLAVRTLGPLWWVSTLVGAVLTIGLPRARQVARLRGARGFIALCVVAGAYGLSWSIIARSNGFVDESPNPGSPWPDMFSQWLLWFFQTIAAAPLRNEYAPTVVYAVALTAWGLGTLVGFLAANRRLRVALCYIVVLASAVGISASAVSYSASGYAWQGRYFYPFTVGFFVLLGLALDRRPARLAVNPRFAAGLIGLAVAVTQVISQVAVRDRGVRTSPLAASGQWQVPSLALLIALSVAGIVLLVVAAASPPRRSTPSHPAGTRTLADSAR